LATAQRTHRLLDRVAQIAGFLLDRFVAIQRFMAGGIGFVVTDVAIQTRRPATRARTIRWRPYRLGIEQSLAGIQPFDRQLEVRIGKARPRPGGERGFSASDVRLPGNLLDLRDGVFRIIEQGSR